MRIGVVTTSYPRFAGDPAGAFVRELNQCMQQVGHEVEVVAAGEPRPELEVAVASPPGLFYEGGAPEALASTRMLLSAAGFSLRMLRQLRRAAMSWDGIVAHWLAPSAIAAALAAPRAPLWIIAHGGDVHLLARLGLVEPTAHLLLRRRVHLSFVSRSLQERFAEAGGRAARTLADRSRVCSMGIDRARFAAAREARPRAEAGAPHRVSFLGRLVPIKGVDLLLRALAPLDAPVELLIAGDGPERSTLESLARQLGVDAHFLGELHGAERDRFVASADTVVLPSRRHAGRSEGMPLVALEALAAGAQVVVSDSGGLRELPDSIVHRVPAEDPQALAQTLQAVIGGHRAPFDPGHWLEARDWSEVAPRLLHGMSHIHTLRRSA